MREVQVVPRSLSQPVANQRSYVCPIVVQNQLYIQFGRNVGFNGVEEAEKLHAAMALLSLSDYLARLRIERSKQTGCAVTCIVMRTALDLAGAHGQQRSSAVQGLYLALSSTHNTRARSGSAKYSPAMSRTFSMNSGSFDNLKVSERCGASEKACQMR